MKKLIILIVVSATSLGLLAQSANEGSFTSLHIKAKNPNQYTDFLKQNAKQTLLTYGQKTLVQCTTGP